MARLCLRGLTKLMTCHDQALAVGQLHTAMNQVLQNVGLGFACPNIIVGLPN